jgi:ABC-type molybdate transport system permease subunit
MLLFIGELAGLGIMALSLIFLVPTILWIWALLDILKSDFKSDIEKIIWLALVIFVPVLGWILYFAIGRSQRINRFY